jgi:hypothetical protein
MPMQNKFNFYDFIGYIIPGSLACVFLYWLLAGFAGFTITIELKSIGESILYLGLAYFLGHLVQAYGNSIEARAVKKWGGWFSEQFLRDDNSYFTPNFKSALRDAMTNVFGESANLGNIDQKARRQELFNLCYSLIVQEGAALHTEIFNGVYSLYRGMLAATNIGILVSLLISAKQAILLLLRFFKVAVPSSSFLIFSEFHLSVGVGSLLFFLLIRRTLDSRFKRFAQHFANSVYRNFYVWFKRKSE